MQQYQCEYCKDTKRILLLNKYVECTECLSDDNIESILEVITSNHSSGIISNDFWTYGV